MDWYQPTVMRWMHSPYAWNSWQEQQKHAWLVLQSSPVHEGGDVRSDRLWQLRSAAGRVERAAGTDICNTAASPPDSRHAAPWTRSACFPEVRYRSLDARKTNVWWGETLRCLLYLSWDYNQFDFCVMFIPMLPILPLSCRCRVAATAQTISPVVSTSSTCGEVQAACCMPTRSMELPVLYLACWSLC